MKDALMLITISAVLTGLVTEAVKKMCGENAKIPANLLAALVSVLVAGLVCAGYIILFDVAMNAKVVVYIVSIILSSWISAMVGYDKLMQSIRQLTTNKS